MSKALNIVLVTLVLGMIGSYLYRKPKFSSDEIAPAFKAELIDGSAFNLTDLRGDYVLLDFWGSWCGPCRRENPSLVQLNNKYKGKTLGDGGKFHIVSIALEKSEKSWKRAIEADQLKWKYHIGQMERMRSSIGVLYGVREIPTKYFLGKNGEIIGVNMTVPEIDAWLASKG